MSVLDRQSAGQIAAGETILWQGQPASGILWRNLLQKETIIGLVFGGFAIFWIIGARSNVPASAPDVFSLIFPLFGLPFVLIGVWLVIGRLIWDAALRSGTHYTLTDRNAYISRDMLGRRSFESWPLDGIKAMHLDDGHPGSVFFEVSAAVRQEHARPLPVRAPLTFRKPELGFRQIDDPRRVHRLIKETQARMGQA